MNYLVWMDEGMKVLDERSKKLRRTVIKMVQSDGRGHLGPALSLIEIFRVLYDDVLTYEVSKPSWQKRDRLILSKGHGCLALYAILHDKGFIAEKDLLEFCKPDGILGGHPEYGKIPGIEASTGSLGHGISIGVGMAIAAKIQKNPYRVFVVVGGGELNEGSNWEGAMSAAHHNLENFIVIVDSNKMQSYGLTKDVMDMQSLKMKWESFGFNVEEVDGHSIEELKACFLRLPQMNKKPNVVICNTTKGKGLKFAENNPEWHHKSNLKKIDIDQMYHFLE